MKNRTLPVAILFAAICFSLGIFIGRHFTPKSATPSAANIPAAHESTDASPTPRASATPAPTAETKPAKSLAEIKTLLDSVTATSDFNKRMAAVVEAANAVAPGDIPAALKLADEL